MAPIQRFLIFVVTILLGVKIAYGGERLKVEGETGKCWESLFELHACSAEVIILFLNGETYLGPSCCNAIRIVGHDCWPQMLASHGFTSEEGDTLQDYCDADQPPSPPSSPTPPLFKHDYNSTQH